MRSMGSGVEWSLSATFGESKATHGSVCWTAPSLVSASEMYNALQVRNWKPLWMRGSSK
jgi:hypothetical protein